MNKEIDKALHLIYTLQEQLCNMPHREGCLKNAIPDKKPYGGFRQYADTRPTQIRYIQQSYKEIFANGTGFSQYDKVCATICEEEYAELPF